MEIIVIQNEITAAFIARVFLGFLFFFQGYDAIFNVKIKNVIETYQESFSQKGIPKFLTTGAAWFTSFAEFVGGLLLIFGIFQYYTLTALGLDIIIASIGFGIVSPMWDMRHVFPRLALLIFLFIIPDSWNAISFDNLFTFLYK